jgi:hypothetical protein
VRFLSQRPRSYGRESVSSRRVLERAAEAKQMEQQVPILLCACFVFVLTRRKDFFAMLATMALFSCLLLHVEQRTSTQMQTIKCVPSLSKKVAENGFFFVCN